MTDDQRADAVSPERHPAAPRMFETTDGFYLPAQRCTHCGRRRDEHLNYQCPDLSATEETAMTETCPPDCECDWSPDAGFSPCQDCGHRTPPTDKENAMTLPNTEDAPHPCHCTNHGLCDDCDDTCPCYPGEARA